MEIEKLVTKIINTIFSNRITKEDYWVSGGKYLPIKKLNNDDTGEVGELLLEDIFRRNGHKVDFEKAVTSEEKDWDIIIDDIKIEVKTATMGSSAKTFQHEKFFKNRSYDILAFLDFTPNELYVTFARKEDIIWKELTKRKVNGVFTSEYKFDMSLNMIKEGKTKKLKKCFISLINEEKDLVNLFNKIKDIFYKK